MNAKEIAYERDSRSVCIICEDPNSQRRLGLCIKHYTRYKKARNRLPPAERFEFDDYLIERGQLMPVRQGRRISDRDEFADAVTEFVASKAGTTPPAEQLAKKLVEEAAAEPPPEKPAKGGGGGRKKG